MWERSTGGAVRVGVGVMWVWVVDGVRQQRDVYETERETDGRTRHTAGHAAGLLQGVAVALLVRLQLRGLPLALLVLQLLPRRLVVLHF
jgi:hypothetical protein